MSKITKVFITTNDTSKTYEMPGYGGKQEERAAREGNNGV